MKHMKISLWICAAAVMSPGSAKTLLDHQCKQIADPAARLACYDEQSGRSAAIDLPATEATPVARPTPRQSTPMVVSHAPDGPRWNGAFESTLAAIVPLRHGYYRLELADGSEFTTTVVAPPPPEGLRVHIRRSPFGTAFLDMEGRKPLTVKPVRRQ